jgi:hypothetical protein
MHTGKQLPMFMNDSSAFTFKVNALRSLQTPVTIYQSTMRNIPEDLNIQEAKNLSRFTEGRFHLRVFGLTLINQIVQ